ncbi:MAG: tetratricopeptide repeat protein [Candidatus Omnitrophota bacterium]
MKNHVSGHTNPSAPLSLKNRLMEMGKRSWFTAFLLAIVIALVYSTTFSSPIFVNHDESVLHLPLLSHAGNIPTLFTSDFLLFTSGQYRPLSYVLLALARTYISPDNLLFWHLWLLGFHIVNIWLIFAIARHFAAKLPAAAAAAFFGLHPLATVLVNDINQFYMILCLTLCLASLKTYLVFSRKSGRILYAASLIFYFLAILTARPALTFILFLLVYEGLYEKTPLKRLLFRLLPFALILALLYPLWGMASPHPLHYKYVAMHEQSFWHGLFSVVGATQEYAGGLFLTRGIPAVLHEIVEQIYNGKNVKFLLWAAVDLSALAIGLWAALRKRWFALGILFLFIGMIPYATVYFNRVLDYVSWTYLYFPAAGLALCFAGIFAWLAEHPWSYLKIGGQAAAAAIVIFFGIRTVQLNFYTRIPINYWTHIYELNHDSQTAMHQSGKVYLAQGQLPWALHHFFAPMATNPKEACIVMARAYCDQGEFLASAIHLRFGSAQETSGIVLEGSSEAAADLLLNAGALDHAEENLGKILMVDPFNVFAMNRLAQVWFFKGFVNEAHRMLERVRAISPADPSAALIEGEFRQIEKQWRENPNPAPIAPPSQDWLNYALTQERSPALRRQIIELGQRADPNDAIIQLEAMIAHLENEEYAEAAKMADVVARCLYSYGYALGAACRAKALAGETDKAIAIGHRAISIASQEPLAWESLAIAYAQKSAENGQTQRFMEDIDKHPSAASQFYSRLGMQKLRTGKKQEAAVLLEKAVKAEPKNLDALQSLGLALYDIGQATRAAEVLQQAVALKPDEAENHARLGRSYIKLNKPNEGVAELRTAIKLDPKKADYHYDLGMVLSSQNRQEESMQEFRRSIELAPNAAAAHFKLANALYFANRFDEAASEYRKTIELESGFGYAHFNLGAVLQRQEKYGEAIREYEEEIRYYPKFAEPFNRIALIYCNQKDYAKAKETIERAERSSLQLDPKVRQELQKIAPASETPE